MVSLVFLPQNYGSVMGTYKYLLLFCKCTWGVGYLATTSCNQIVCGHGGWGPKKPNLKLPSHISL